MKKYRIVTELDHWANGSGFTSYEVFNEEIGEFETPPKSWDDLALDWDPECPREYDTKITATIYEEEDEWHDNPIASFSKWNGTIWNEKQADDYWDSIVNLMDDEKRETVHAELAPCSKLDFLERYCRLDPEFIHTLCDEFDIFLD